VKGLRKGLYALLTIYLSLTSLFFIIRLAPGDPVERILGPEARLQDIELLRQRLGLDLSVWEQYLSFCTGIMTGNLGNSLFKSEKISSLILTHLPPTIIIAFFSISLAFFLGSMLGIYSGARKSQIGDGAVRVLSLLALSFPIFSLAPLFVLIFSIWLQWLPVSEWGGFSHGVLPILSLTVPLAAILTRVSRNRFLEEIHAPWVTVLHAKGLREMAILVRVLKACLPTLLNVVAIQLSVVLAGTMITETIFDIPGMGMLLFEGIQNRDYPVVQGVIAYSTIIYMLIYFCVDSLNSWIDPRIQS